MFEAENDAVGDCNFNHVGIYLRESSEIRSPLQMASYFTSCTTVVCRRGATFLESVFNARIQSAYRNIGHACYEAHICQD